MRYALDRCPDARVWINGAPLSQVLAADPDEGWVEVPPQGGERHDGACAARLTGRVRVELGDETGG